MIIGNGLIANSLKDIDSEDNIFFASGVSNSLETRSSEFEREFTLLKNTLENTGDRKLIYFSTLSVNDQSKQNSHYVLHKLAMEDYIKKYSDNYLILRIGNIVGKGGNPNTLFNYLNNQIKNTHKFTVHNKARRLLIDMDDITKFLEINCILLGNSIVNCAFPYYYDLKEIIGAIEKKTQQKGIYSESDEGDFYKVDFGENITSFFSGISPEDYLETLTQKYI
ncbi:MAG: NAD-dependent epimerase/dehydratase family protein [Chryseobacterium jejuense]|uniref:NAD-dependent epimerase/dehydratase family protein n=1 Tax=Chryseobacterium jejuense TaxID=445960 RepID=UPI003D0F8ECE